MQFSNNSLADMQAIPALMSTTRLYAWNVNPNISLSKTIKTETLNTDAGLQLL